MKLKVGDLVRLKPVKVIETCTERGYFRADGPTQGWMHNVTVEEILPPPLAAGDRVRHRYGTTGRVVATRTNVGTRRDAAWWRHAPTSERAETPRGSIGTMATLAS